MNAVLGFRTITKCFLHRYTWTGVPPVLTPVPLNILIPPSDAEINPGINMGEIKSRSCRGPMQTALTFPEDNIPKLKLTFDVVGPELEQLITGRVAKTATNTPSNVIFEVLATSATIPGKATGEHGSQVTAQTATSGAMAYYIDPRSKLSKPLAIVASNPTGDQIVIGAGLAITLSPELANTGYLIRGRVPVVAPTATVMSNEQMGMVGVFLSGIYHDGTAKEFSALFCSLEYGASITAESKRQISLRVLPNANSRSGLGWDVEDIPLQVAC